MPVAARMCFLLELVSGDWGVFCLVGVFLHKTAFHELHLSRCKSPERFPLLGYSGLPSVLFLSNRAYLWDLKSQVFPLETQKLACLFFPGACTPPPGSLRVFFAPATDTQYLNPVLQPSSPSFLRDSSSSLRYPARYPFPGWAPGLFPDTPKETPEAFGSESRGS